MRCDGGVGGGRRGGAGRSLLHSVLVPLSGLDNATALRPRRTTPGLRPVGRWINRFNVAPHAHIQWPGHLLNRGIQARRKSC